MAKISVLARGGASWLFLRAPRLHAGFTASRARAFSLVDRVPGGAPQQEAAPAAEKVSVQWTVGDEQSTSKKCDPYEQGGKHLTREQAEANRTQVPFPLPSRCSSPGKRYLGPGSLARGSPRRGEPRLVPRARLA